MAVPRTRRPGVPTSPRGEEVKAAMLGRLSPLPLGTRIFSSEYQGCHARRRRRRVLVGDDACKRPDRSPPEGGFVLPARWAGKTKPPPGGTPALGRGRVNFSRRRRPWPYSLQSEAEGRGDATKRGSFSRGGERGECCKDERDARWRFCLEDDRVSLPRHPPSRPPDLPPSRPPVRLIYRLCRARSERSSVASLCLSSALLPLARSRLFSD